MVQVNYGTHESIDASRRYISAAGRASIVLVIATLMVMMVSTAFLVFGTERRNDVVLDEFDPVDR
jgi:hypothetical protein